MSIPELKALTPALLMVALWSMAGPVSVRPCVGQELEPAVVWISDVQPGPRSRISEPSLPPEDSSHARWYAPAIRKQRLGIKEFTDVRLAAVKPRGESSNPVGGDSAPDNAINIRADQVVWIRPIARSDGEHAGLRQIVLGEHGDALRTLLKSLESRPPIWRQQFISMAASQCAARGGRGAISLELVRQLGTRPLPPMVLGWLPIEWRSRTVPAVSKQDAVAKFDFENANASNLTSLVLASWQMDTKTESAMSELRGIATNDEEPLVASLAKLVQFRSATPIKVKREWKQTLTQIESLPLTMQMGPLVMLAEKLMAAGEQPEADKLITSLEVAPVCPHPDVLESMQAWR